MLTSEKNEALASVPPEVLEVRVETGEQNWQTVLIPSPLPHLAQQEGSTISKPVRC
jgi:hypothetical protein